MRIKKWFIVIVTGVGLLLPGCGEWCRPAKKEAQKKPVMPAPQVAKSPCEAPQMGRTVQSYPAGDTRGNAISLEKMVPKEVAANEPFEYQIKVTNLTDRELYNVVVKDCVPKNLVFKSSSPEISRVEGGNVYWMLGNLEPKASRMISANAVAEGEEPITSCAQVTYDSPICAKINIVEPKLQMAKFAPSDSLMCDRIPVRYVITNTGSGYACNITLKDQFQEGLMTAEGKNEVMFTLDSLGPGKSHEFKTMLDANRRGKFASKAIATSRNIGTVESNMTETTVSQPVLAITESGPDSQYIGRSLTYEITVTNKGDATAKDTVIEAMLPEDVKFDSASLDGHFSRSSPAKVVWNIGELAPNASKKVSMTLMVDQAGSLKTIAAVKAYCAEAVSTSMQTTLSGIPGILLEVIDVADPTEVGQNNTYVITVTNQGSASDTNIRINCTLEDNMKYVSSSGPTTASVTGNNVDFAPLPSLAPKAQAQWRVNIEAFSAGDVRFKVIMNSDQLGRPVEETEATTFYK
jgi:uncharacterized repeat protein (TIGR01451 family)